MSEIATREFELSALAFLLSKPIYYAQKRKDLTAVKFSDKKINRILECLEKSWSGYSEFPTKSELKEKLKKQLWDQSGEVDIAWQEYEDILDDIYARPTSKNTGEQLNLYMADEARKKLADKLLSCSLDDLPEVSKLVESELKSLRRVHYQELDFGLDFFSKTGLKQVAEDMRSYMDGDCFPSGYELLDKAMKGGTRKGELSAILGSTGTGKAQPLDALVYTPSGFVPMGSLKLGDKVVDKDGYPVKVVGVFPQGIKDVYRVAFSDGTSAECCEDHLWLSKHWADEHFSVRPLKEMLEYGIKTKYNRNVWQIPNFAGLLDEKKDELPLDPYVLGVLLGNGALAAACPIFHTADTFIVEKVGKLLAASGMAVAPKLIQGSREIGYTLVGEKKASKSCPNPVKAALRKLNLAGCNSDTKFFPAAYLQASADSRLAVLQGLMDTDGHNANNISVDYCSASLQLVEGVEFLVRSLGGHCTRSATKRVKGKPYYRSYIQLDLNPFSLPRKAEGWVGQNLRSVPKTKVIEKVELVGQKECQCISVDSHSQTYVTNDFVVTHNTTMLINLTKGFVSGGHRIVHVYLDSLRSEMAVRAGTCFLRREIDFNEDMDEVAAQIGAAYPDFEGKLWFKQYPAREINVDDLDEFVENLKAYLYAYDIDRGVFPEDAGQIDGMILDTIDLLDYGGREEGFMIDEAKATKVNAICVRHNMFIWTGTQAGTDGMKNDKMKLHMAHGYKSRFHPMANIVMLSVPEEERQALVRHIDLDFGKARRPLCFSSIPFILDVCTQTFSEDLDRSPKTGGAAEKAGAPEQSAEAKGKPVAPKSAEEVAHAWG